MRLDASIFGLVAWLGASMAIPSETSYPTLPTPKKAYPPNSIITFTYPSPTSHVFAVKPQDPMVEWSVSAGQTVNVKNATLFVVDNVEERLIAAYHGTTSWSDRISHTVPSGTPDLEGDLDQAGKPIKGGLFFETPSEPSEKRQSSMSSVVDLPFQFDPSTGLGSVTMKPRIYQTALEKKMFLSLEWIDKTGSKGKSFSTPFALSEQASGQASSESLSALVADLDKYDQSTPWRREGPSEGPGSNPLIIIPASATSTAASTATSAAAADGGTSEKPETSNNGGPEGQAGGNGGLSTGAIAGIVVGAVIGGLLIISALAYFLCFRRRSGNRRSRHDIHGDVGYASDSGAAGMITREKDMAGVNHSPQSAYADDGSRLHNVGDLDHGNESTNYSNTPQEERGVATGQNRDSVHHNDYSLYNNGNGNPDQVAAATQRHSTIGVAVSPQDADIESRRERTRSVGNVAAVVGRTSHQTSRPGSEARSPSRYAHLIEEGMTEDEIRRLEDEERQLDAAIEDAGRHGNRPQK